jgi:hypothetical protein
VVIVSNRRQPTTSQDLVSTFNDFSKRALSLAKTDTLPVMRESRIDEKLHVCMDLAPNTAQAAPPTPLPLRRRETKSRESQEVSMLRLIDWPERNGAGPFLSVATVTEWQLAVRVLPVT